MDQPEHLLTVLIEECSEVIKACTKALRFGLDDTWPGPESGLPQWDLTPRQEIRHELNDIAGVVRMMRDQEILPERNWDDIQEEDRKIGKVCRLMGYAEKAGTLTHCGKRCPNCEPACVCFKPTNHGQLCDWACQFREGTDAE